MSAIERYSPGGAVALTDRDMRSIEFQSKAIAFLDARLKDMPSQQKTDTAIALALTLHSYGRPITPVEAKKLHLINGEPVASGQLLLDLLQQVGHVVRPVTISSEKVTLRGWVHGRGEPIEITYTIDEAKASGALDEWVEEWGESSKGRSFLKGRMTIRVDGVEANAPWPKWVEAQIAAGRVKRKDAWFLYRSDMLVNRCIRRLARWLGTSIDPSLFGDDDEAEPATIPPAAPNVDPYISDDDVEDAELVDEGEGPEPSSAPPANPSPSSAPTEIDEGGEGDVTEPGCDVAGCAIAGEHQHDPWIAQVAAMEKADLVRELVARDLPTNGSVDVLRARLMEVDQ